MPYRLQLHIGLWAGTIMYFDSIRYIKGIRIRKTVKLLSICEVVAKIAHLMCQYNRSCKVQI